VNKSFLITRTQSLNTLCKLLAPLLAAVPLIVFAEQITLDQVVVTAPDDTDSILSASDLDEEALASKQAGTSDTSRLLQDVPGMSLYGAGGISSLPAIHGMGGDRIRIQVDGMDLLPACPNHMNSALSYISPTRVGSVKVYAGISPVSVGGDSIGGTIQVEPKPPEFARPDEDAFFTGEAGTFFRSNANAFGYNFGLTWVGHDMNMSYSESNAQADNYTAAKDFKEAEPGTEGGPVIP
jgi:iron complex outermembrane receptor protein